MNNQVGVIDRIRSFLPVTNTVTMINSYRGVPISYDGHLIGIDDNVVKLRVHKFQAVCMELTKRTFFMNDFLPTVQANVLEKDFENTTVVLNDLKFTDNAIGKRKTIRVSPKEPIPVVINRKNSSHQIVASLVDISVIGVGVYWMSVFMEEVRSFISNTEVSVSITLPASNGKALHNLELGGTVLNVLPIDGVQRFRLGLRIVTDNESQKQIKDFVAFQQSEIIREIKVLYDVLLRLSHEKDN